MGSGGCSVGCSVLETLESQKEASSWLGLFGLLMVSAAADVSEDVCSEVGKASLLKKDSDSVPMDGEICNDHSTDSYPFLPIPYILSLDVFCYILN